MNFLEHLPYGGTCKNVYIVYFAMFAVIMFYYVMFLFRDRSPVGRDMFNNIVFEDVPLFGNLSWWPISHFVMYTVLGFLFPQCYVLILTVGVLWELYEKWFSTVAPRNTAGSQSRAKQEYSTWWDWNWKDVVMNVLGFGFGVLLRKIILDR